MSARRKPSSKPKSTSAERTRAYRERMRAKGLKQVTIWTYDLSDPAFVARIREQSRALAQRESEKEIMDWIEAVQIEDGLWD